MTKNDLNQFFNEIDAMLVESEEAPEGVVAFIKMQTRGHVYGVGESKERMIESMEVMVKELREGHVSLGRVN